MLLAIDCGNTNTVFAIYSDGTQVGSWRVATNAHRTADEYAVWLTQLMALKGVHTDQVTGAVIASVVPDAKFPLRSLVRAYFGTEPLVIGEPGVELGIQILIDRPEQAGADRLMNAVAVHARHSGATIVVDFGTATNFDIIDGDGNFFGGVFAPGVNLSVEALFMASAQLPRVELKRPERVIGKSTVPAIQSGIFWGYVSMIEGLIARIKDDFGAPMQVIATGGLAPLFAAEVPAIDAVDPDLTMRGLVEVYRRNTRP